MFADSAYQGPVFHRALAGILPDLETEIVKRSDRVKGFVVQPRRWVVERTIAWPQPLPPTGQDWENLNRNALAFIKLASIRSCSENSVILHKVSGRTLRDILLHLSFTSPSYAATTSDSAVTDSTEVGAVLNFLFTAGVFVAFFWSFYVSMHDSSAPKRQTAKGYANLFVGILIGSAKGTLGL